jgi:hypothetical protein
MIRFISGLALTMAVAGVCLAAAATRRIPVAAGTLIRCTLDEEDFSPKTEKQGDPLVCYAKPLREFDCSVFPAGTELAGRLVASHKPGRFVGKGWMRLDFDRLILPEGETQINARVVAIEGRKVDRQGRILGHGHPTRDELEWATPPLWPVKVLTLPMRGPEPALKGERVVTVRLLDDITMPCVGYSGLIPWGESNLLTPSRPSSAKWRLFSRRNQEP